MRKETADIVEAFMAGKPCARARTYTDGNKVYLHGNLIFWRNEDEPGVYHFTLAGWPTVTTRDRVTALLWAVWDAKGGPRRFDAGRWTVYQRNHVQYLNRPEGPLEIDPNETCTVA